MVRAGLPDVRRARRRRCGAARIAQVFANGAFSDWLLLKEPSLRGRIAYDARFEVLPDGRLADAAAVSIGRFDAERILRPFDVVVLRPEESELRGTLERAGSWRRIDAGVEGRRAAPRYWLNCSLCPNAKRNASCTSAAGSSAHIRCVRTSGATARTSSSVTAT